MRRLFVLSHRQARERAAAAILEAPEGYVVEVKEPTRSLEQNARMWAQLHDVSAQVDWYGRKLTPEDWKTVFTAALKRYRTVPGIDGGFVVLGVSTSRMSKSELSELMELIAAFGAERGVVFGGEHVDASAVA